MAQYISGIYLMLEATNSQIDAVQYNREPTWSTEDPSNHALRYKDESGVLHYIYENPSGSGELIQFDNGYAISSQDKTYKTTIGLDAVDLSNTTSGNLGGAEGVYSFTTGQNTYASGHYAHAFGDGSRALGSTSHATGMRTKAYGYASHTEGHYSVASGDASHAEGYNTIAYGDYSHVEGMRTIAYAIASHAEGDSSVVSGIYAGHAEGFHTTAYTDGGPGAHAEGVITKAYGYASHAEGENTQAIGASSHAEGGYTITSGIYSHAEGEATTSIGNSSHAEGAGTRASGNYSHAEGNGTQANANSAHAEGHFSIANGDYSHAGGYFTVAYNDYMTAIGKYNDPQEESIFEIGIGTSSSGLLNAFRVTNSGLAFSDEATNDMIDAASDQVLTTKGYVDANMSSSDYWYSYSNIIYTHSGYYQLAVGDIDGTTTAPLETGASFLINPGAFYTYSNGKNISSTGSAGYFLYDYIDSIEGSGSVPTAQYTRSGLILNDDTKIADRVMARLYRDILTIGTDSNGSVGTVDYITPSGYNRITLNVNDETENTIPAYPTGLFNPYLAMTASGITRKLEFNGDNDTFHFETRVKGDDPVDSDDFATKNYVDTQVSYGLSADRPSGVVTTGTQYFNTSLGYPIWFNGTFWSNSTGAYVLPAL